MKSQQFIRFLLAGGTAALANFGSRICLSYWMPYVPAIIVAYVVGMITAFVLNRLFVFTSSQNPIHNQIYWFILVNVAAVTQTALISVWLADYVLPMLHVYNQTQTIAHAVGVTVPIATSYVGHKHLTFRKS